MGYHVGVDHNGNGINDNDTNIDDANEDVMLLDSKKKAHKGWSAIGPTASPNGSKNFPPGYPWCPVALAKFSAVLDHGVAHSTDCDSGLKKSPPISCSLPNPLKLAGVPKGSRTRMELWLMGQLQARTMARHSILGRRRFQARQPWDFLIWGGGATGLGLKLKGKGKSPVKVLPSSGVAEEIPLKLRNITPTSVERLSLSLTDFFSGETTPYAVKFKIKGGSKPAGQPGLMGASSSSAHENVSRVEFEEFKKCLSVVVSQQGILMKSVAEMNKKLDILIEPEQSQGGEENIDVDATIASAVKAVENLIGSSTHVPASVETSEKTDIEMVVFQETPILRPQKRDRKKGAVLKSPFIELASGASKSGSSSVSPDDSVYKVVKYVRGLCPLDNKIGEPVDPQLEVEFVKWVDTGLRKHKSNTTTNVYCKGKDTIFPPFRFGVEDISNKMWFHNLAYPNCFLTNSCCSHIDIIFYYLRKKIIYSAEQKIKVTTTDCLFCSSITSLYEKFVEKNNDISVFSLSHNVAQYIQGGKILCATPWDLVDHVVMPINVKLQDHWICGRLNIAERRIYLYNSLRSGRYMTAAKEACKPFAVILPYYFSMLDFKGLRNEAKFSTMESFPIVAVDGLPEQVTADCGVFVASFAEYFIDGKPIPSSGFDVEIHRDRLAVLFYQYGMKKQTENIESESEAPPILPKK
ncbi:hypothetical protein G4B88_004393 [Cannabis sativa]|uniref:Ubiquitin-like protease family profile domain-containing protein n=1 Tax=Cannabis sativa TaxID=3483 RepID=A0A7J6I2K4_CANSA|nr:hypothetical protein G4B88_004393 [Cannabis sativa]